MVICCLDVFILTRFLCLRWQGTPASRPRLEHPPAQNRSLYLGTKSRTLWKREGNVANVIKSKALSPSEVCKGESCKPVIPREMDLSQTQANHNPRTPWKHLLRSQQHEDNHIKIPGNVFKRQRKSQRGRVWADGGELAASPMGRNLFCHGYLAVFIFKLYWMLMLARWENLV